MTAQQEARFETMQRHAGCQLLGLPRSRSAHVMVRGELGWVRMTARRDAAQLRFLHRLHSMPAGLLTHHVYEVRRRSHERHLHRRRQQEQQEEEEERRRGKGVSSEKKKMKKKQKADPQYGFFMLVQRALDRYGLSLPSTAATSAQSISSNGSISSGRASTLARRAANLAKVRWARAVDKAVLALRNRRGRRTCVRRRQARHHGMPR